MVGREGNRRIVVAADSAVQVLGIRLGTPAIKAQALVAGLVIQDANPDGDRAGLERLAVRALRYSPVVAADPPNGLVMDTTGADHLHGGENAMLSEVVEKLAGAGVTARVAVSDTWGADARLRRREGHRPRRWSGQGSGGIADIGAAARWGHRLRSPEVGVRTDP
jgi:protein ImuB